MTKSIGRSFTQTQTHVEHQIDHICKNLASANASLSNVDISFFLLTTLILNQYMTYVKTIQPRQFVRVSSWFMCFFHNLSKCLNSPLSDIL